MNTKPGFATILAAAGRTSRLAFDVVVFELVALGTRALRHVCVPIHFAGSTFVAANDSFHTGRVFYSYNPTLYRFRFRFFSFGTFVSNVVSHSGQILNKVLFSFSSTVIAVILIHKSMRHCRGLSLIRVNFVLSGRRFLR